jgi:alanyl-tRNA synthetase
VFEMGDQGLSEVPNPSEALLSGRPQNTPGSCVTCVMEGVRPVLAEVQALVNDAISRKLTITCEEMSVEAAREAGAMGLFGNKYGEVVKVYTMGDVSKEICGGPHAGNTGDLACFKILKEESSSRGVRRIKAVIGEAATK